jgi:hypothetical protein
MVAVPNPGIGAASVHVAEPSEAVVQIGDPEARSKYEVAFAALTVMATLAPTVEAEMYFGKRFALADVRAGILSTSVTPAFDAVLSPDVCAALVAGSDVIDPPPLQAASESEAPQIIVADASMIGRVSTRASSGPCYQ